MQFNESTNTITTYRYDYGIPITFEAGVDQGFSVGDQIAIVFDDDRITDRDDITVNKKAKQKTRSKRCTILSITVSRKRSSKIPRSRHCLTDTALSMRGDSNAD